MKNSILFLFVIVSFCSLLNSVIWEIKQDSTGDFSTIQPGINAAANSDTVLVYPGIYYENLEILEKAITLGSLYLTTGDDFYVGYTILDGNHTSSVIRIEDTPSYFNVIITGFVIQNGIGYLHTSQYRSGGGIYLLESKAIIRRCFIQKNKTKLSGGGIAVVDSNLELFNSTIRYNESRDVAGGISIGNSNINFCNENLNNIYLNYSTFGNDIFISHNSPFQEIIVDTFTVINPDDDYYFIYPHPSSGLPQPGQFSVDIQHGYVEQVEQDVYVSADGDDDNSGLSPTDPLKTIAFAMVKIRSDSLQKRTVHVMDGLYSVSQNDQILPVQVKSHIDIVGESMENTILDGEHQRGFFVGKSGQKNFSIRNFTMLHNFNQVNVRLWRTSNAHLENLYVDDGFCQSLFSQVSDVTMKNVTQVNTTGGGVYYNSGLHTGIFNMIDCKFQNNYGNIPVLCYDASNSSLDSLIFSVINTEITDNLEIGSEWLPRSCAIKIDWGTKLNLINSTIGNNTSLSIGAAVQLLDESEANIVNSIIYGNLPYNLCLNGTWGPNTLNAYNSLIGGGINGILNIGQNYINWIDEKMFDTDPLWLGAGYEYPYALSADSPCINMGTLELPYGVELPAYDLAGNPRVMGSAIDIGAYEFPDNPAPIYLQMDNETLFWQIPPGCSPTGYNVYLDESFQAYVGAFSSQYTFSNLIFGETYQAGVSALYNAEETAVIPLQFVYEPVGIEEETTYLSPLSSHITNYPNPFNPSTTISFSIEQNEQNQQVELCIFNIKGQKVKTLIDAVVSATEVSCTWNGKDENGKRVASGQYTARLTINGEEKAVRKIMLVK